MSKLSFPRVIMSRLPDELREQTEIEVEIFTKKFKEDIFGTTDKNVAVMLTNRDKWLLDMLALTSAKSNFLGDWCSELQDTIDKD